MKFEFAAPGRLIFGEGTFNRLGEQAARLGRRAMLVTGRSALVNSGYVQQALDLLVAAGVSGVAFSEVPANPTVEIAEQGGNVARTEGCDVIIGLGGGSAMDCAKAIAVCATHDRPLRAFLEPGSDGLKATPGPQTLPIIAVTSTAGTSSELTPFAVITVSDTKEKSAMVGDPILPRVAIEDPELTYSAPPEVTAATGIDVLCHAVESIVSTAAQPLTTLLALEAVRLVGEWLPVAYSEGSHREARRQMMLANTYAGYALAHCGGSVMHALEHPVSGHYPHVAHGAGLAAFLLPWARLVAAKSPELVAPIAHALSPTTHGLGTVEAAREAEVHIGQLLQAVNLRLRLRDVGVVAEDLEMLAGDAWRYMGKAVAKTPGELSCEELLELLEAAY
jgi:alcohol dehydrogenase class IV